jgi:hypothetical protein
MADRRPSARGVQRRHGPEGACKAPKKNPLAWFRSAERVNRRPQEEKGASASNVSHGARVAIEQCQTLCNQTELFVVTDDCHGVARAAGSFRIPGRAGMPRAPLPARDASTRERSCGIFELSQRRRAKAVTSIRFGRTCSKQMDCEHRLSRRVPRLGASPSGDSCACGAFVAEGIDVAGNGSLRLRAAPDPLARRMPRRRDGRGAGR